MTFMLPFKPALGHMCATHVLWVSTSKSSWGRTGHLQEAVPCLTGANVGTYSLVWNFTHSVKYRQLAFASPVYSLMLQLGVPVDIYTGAIFLLKTTLIWHNQASNLLGCVASLLSHTRTHARTHTHTHTHTQAYVHTTPHRHTQRHKNTHMSKFSWIWVKIPNYDTM